MLSIDNKITFIIELLLIFIDMFFSVPNDTEMNWRTYCTLLHLNTVSRKQVEV